MSELLAAIDFGSSGDSARYLLDGWGQQEPGHRWTIGAESQVHLPVTSMGPDCVVVIDAAPWCDPTDLPRQSYMLSINGRLLETVQLCDHTVLALRVPALAAEQGHFVFRIDHLNASSTRSDAGRDRSGRPLGLLVTSLRVFRLTSSLIVSTQGVGPNEPDLVAATLTGMTPEQLVTRFEPVGLNCEFGSVQRHFGAEPLGLLRFVGMSIFKLVDALMARFEQLGSPDATHVFPSDDENGVFKVYEAKYVFWYSTNIRVGAVASNQVRAAQCRRLAFLRRKFLEDLQAGEKIFLLNHRDPISEAEALAVYCALQLEGPNRLLWTVPSDSVRVGQVDRVRPGLMRGHLGTTDDRGYANHQAWLNVLTRALVMMAQ